jgi:hypothetical protein
MAEAGAATANHAFLAFGPDSFEDYKRKFLEKNYFSAKLDGQELEPS